jgi:hypothetical protein
MSETDGIRERRAEEALEPFFAAARARESAPPVPLLHAILKDAAEADRPRARMRRLRAAVAPVGGWPGLAALAACAAPGGARVR